MAFCSKCGNEVGAAAAFCSNCGNQTNQTQAAPPPIPGAATQAPPPIPKATVPPVPPTPSAPPPPPISQPQYSNGKIAFSIEKKERLNMVKVELENSAFRYEAGAMHYMKGNLDLQSNVPGAGKILKSLVTKEKIVKPVIVGTGTVFLEPSFGEFTILDLNNEEWILDQGAYYASEMDIEVGAFTNRAVSAMFSGEKWFQTTVAGTGKVIITSAGPLEEIELNNDKLVVDGAFAVARTAGIDLKVTKATKGIFSTIISGEGLVNTFTGTGKMLIAPVDNYFNTLISVIRGIDYKIQRLGNKS